MKLFLSLLFVTSILFAGLPIESMAQDLPEKAAKKAKNKANRRVDRKVDKSIDKGLDKIEGIFKKKDKKKNKSKNKTEDDFEDYREYHPDMSKEEEIELWSVRYDFKPGAEIIFFDDFEGEEVGEIPGKWKYIKGDLETVEESNAGNVLRWTDHTAPNFAEEFELPERWTMEFDVYLKGPPYNASYNYYVNLGSADLQYTYYNVKIGMGSLHVGSTAGSAIPDTKKEDFLNSWHHVSLSYNKGSFKGYFDQYRLFNMRLDKPVGGIQLRNCCTTRNSETVFLVDNVMIAEGAHPKYKEEIVNGKIVVHNIHFDYNSAGLLPRSYAEISRMAEFMADNPELSFRIDGHTDGDGDEEYNLQLSEQRAKAVKEALVSRGVETDRLSTKGWGESSPLDDNDTPEGKAMNRRVEFVKTD